MSFIHSNAVLFELFSFYLCTTSPPHICYSCPHTEERLVSEEEEARAYRFKEFQGKNTPLRRLCTVTPWYEVQLATRGRRSTTFTANIYCLQVLTDFCHFLAVLFLQSN